ncbi:MAG: hypothetical protein EBX54_12365, partial [Betaproteobacteria bacterium]|nr:hypothetical protein [Betaproteobacteria bacterium]
VVQKKVFPGYLLVRCDMTDDSWYVIRNTPGITGFVGQAWALARLGQLLPIPVMAANPAIRLSASRR